MPEMPNIHPTKSLRMKKTAFFLREKDRIEQANGSKKCRISGLTGSAPFQYLRPPIHPAKQFCGLDWVGARRLKAADRKEK